MHKVKLFSDTADMASIPRLQNEINQWLKDAKNTFNAMVIHRTDMIYAGHLIVFSIYYTYLINETEKDGAATDTGTTG